MASCVNKEFQNDTFFTIALGERTVEYGIEEFDGLVWHENLTFIHLRWLFDVLIYKINAIFGYLGIYIFVIVMSIIQGLLYYTIANKITKNKIISFLATIITMYFTKGEIAARGQVMSFTLFLLEFYCIEQLIETNKNRYALLLLIIPVLIVNFHASVFPVYFVFYLPYIAEYILSKINLKNDKESKLVVEKRNIIKLIILMICGLALGFCSPIGINAYKYMFNVMSGVSADFISELQPIDLMRESFYTFLLCAIIGMFAFTKTKVRITDALYIIGFILLSLPTYRCIFFFYLFGSLCFLRILNDFIKDHNFDTSFINSKVKLIVYSFILINITIFSISELFNEMVEDYVNSADMPINATNYILANIDLEEMRIFNHFNFGSYLEEKGIKVFLDSRSEMYTEEFNPGVTILKDWRSATTGEENYKKLFNEYKITHALLYNDELINQYISEDEEWTRIYQDDRFSLYEKNNK